MTQPTTSAVLLTSSTAVLTLHLQNEVLDAEGVVGRHGIAAVVTQTGLIANVRQLLARAATAGVPIVHVVFAGNGVGSCSSTAPALRRGARIGFQPDTWGTQVVAGLVQPADRVVVHDTMSAFSGTDLAATLTATGIDRIVLAGVSTHLVVAASAFAAADLGFDVAVAADCCAAPELGTHQSALAQLSSIAEVVAGG